MYIVVAKDHTAYEKFLQERFHYIGSLELDKIDPDQVKEIIFAEGFDKHPTYFSDDFFKLQCEVAARHNKPNKRWWQRW